MEDLIVNNRPVNLDLRTIRMPVTAILSILHRISGVILFFGMPILLWMFGKSLSSANEFQYLQNLLENVFVKLMFLSILAALSYHIIAGVKHLMMDRGIGETKQGAKISSIIVILISLVVFTLLGTQL